MTASSVSSLALPRPALDGDFANDERFCGARMPARSAGPTLASQFATSAALSGAERRRPRETAAAQCGCDRFRRTACPIATVPDWMHVSVSAVTVSVHVRGPIVA